MDARTKATSCRIHSATIFLLLPSGRNMAIRTMRITNSCLHIGPKSTRGHVSGLCHIRCSAFVPWFSHVLLVKDASVPHRNSIATSCIADCAEMYCWHRFPIILLHSPGFYQFFASFDNICIIIVTVTIALNRRAGQTAIPMSFFLFSLLRLMCLVHQITANEGYRFDVSRSSSCPHSYFFLASFNILTRPIL
jgi:hypothetical protein